MDTDSKPLNHEQHSAATELEAEWTAACHRVCESPQFRKAPRMRDLLAFLVQEKLKNPQKEMTEYEIAESVFGRSSGFDPAESNVVRVAIRQLRSKLKEYYESADATEKWAIELPKGGYRVSFVERPVAVSPPPQRQTRMIWVLGLLAAASLLAALWLYSDNHRLRAAAESKSEPSFLSTLVDSFEGPVEVVTADPGYVLMKSFGVQLKTLSEYESNSFLADPAPKSLPSPAPAIWQALLSRQIMNVADINILYRLAGQMRKPAPRVRMARQLKTRDFRSGNFVILGTNSSNPWHLVFAEKLNFRFEGDVHQHRALRNTSPRPGEPTVFLPQHPNSDDSYALACLTENLTGTGKVLLIAGYTMMATEAAGDFLLNPSHRPLIENALARRPGARSPAFEIVLRTHSVSGTAKSAEIVAVR